MNDNVSTKDINILNITNVYCSNTINILSIFKEIFELTISSILKTVINILIMIDDFFQGFNHAYIDEL